MKRDKMEIIRSILLICKNGAKKTEIVYKANLNFKSAGAYLDWLINRKMITKEDESFKTTAKGNELLSNLQSTSKLMDLK
jgi:predicted transcriptional regulator